MEFVEPRPHKSNYSWSCPFLLETGALHWDFRAAISSPDSKQGTLSSSPSRWNKSGLLKYFQGWFVPDTDFELLIEHPEIWCSPNTKER
jgi:hypothetical protein